MPTLKSDIFLMDIRRKPVTEKLNYRSKNTGRLISHAERVAAAKARIAADLKRGVTTDAWIIELANKSH